MRGISISEMQRADAALRAMDMPRFGQMGLPDDLVPENLVKAMLELLAHSRAFVVSFDPLLDAMIAEDAETVQKAGNQTTRSSGGLSPKRGALRPRSARPQPFRRA